MTNTWGDNIREQDVRAFTAKRLLQAALVVILLLGVVVIYLSGQRSTSVGPDQSFSDAPDYGNLLPSSYMVQPVARIEPVKLVASLEGFGIEETDIRLDLIRRGIPRDNWTGAERKQSVDNVALKLVMANQALRNDMHKNDLFQAEIRRFYVERLASRFLEAKLAEDVTVTGAEVRRFIKDNPGLFQDREYFTFDTLSVPTSALGQLESKAVEESLTLEDVGGLLEEKGISYRRQPFNAYSEELPQDLLTTMPVLKETGRPFYLKRGAVANIAVLLSSQRTPIEPARRFELARARLLANAKAEALRVYEQEAKALAKPILRQSFDSAPAPQRGQ